MNISNKMLIQVNAFKANKIIGIFFVFIITSCANQNSFIDERDGNEYKIVKIGNQIWMAENLAYLPYVNTPYEYSNDEPRFYVFNNEQKDVIKAKELGTYRDFGVLYNQMAAKMSCPEGWHLPSDAEWEQLITYIDKESKSKFRHIDDVWYDIGNILKSSSGWIENPGIDSYKFGALPGGCIQFGYSQTNKGTYDFLGSSGFWWSSSEYFSTASWMRWLDDDDTFRRDSFTRSYGYSVRCIKNNN